jgi:GDP-L-fucose synthase
MRTVPFEARVEFDATKPDGTPQKLLDVSRLSALGWRARIGFAEGLAATYQAFLQRAGS